MKIDNPFPVFGCFSPTNFTKLSIALSLFFGAAAAYAWVEQWAPKFDATPAKVHSLPKKSVQNYVTSAMEDYDYANYCKNGGYLDLNGDGIDDFVFIIPWMGCGLNASGYYVHFIVSDGRGGRMKNTIEGYGVDFSDFVTATGKIYFRHSYSFNDFEKSPHNHWVYQVFSFDKTGVMKCANSDFGNKFPAATIFYDDPKFKQIELTDADRVNIKKVTTPKSSRYVP